jgi:hypothetical protein
VEVQLVRSYRPSFDSLDQRPTRLSGGSLVLPDESLELIVTSALRKRGNVVIQQAAWLHDIEKVQYARSRAREAERAEQRL